MLDKYSNIQKDILKYFKDSYNFYYAADSVCSKYGISIVLREDELCLYYNTQKSKNKKKIPDWLKNHNIGTEIIWSCVTLYWDLLEENLVFDFGIKSDFVSGELGDPFSSNADITIDEEVIPTKVKREFKKIIDIEFFPTQEFKYFCKKNFKTREAVRHTQILVTAWVGIGISIVISTLSILF